MILAVVLAGVITMVLAIIYAEFVSAQYCAQPGVRPPHLSVHLYSLPSRFLLSLTCVLRQPIYRRFKRVMRSSLRMQVAILFMWEW